MENIKINEKINEIKDFKVEYVDGKKVIIVTYEDGEFDNIPYNEKLAIALKKYEISMKNATKQMRDCLELKQLKNADTTKVEEAEKAAKDAIEEVKDAKRQIVNEVEADKKVIVAIPGTEKTYKETTGLNNEEYGKAVVDKTTAEPKTEKKSNGWGYVLATGAVIGVVAFGLKGCADKMKTADDYKPATNTIETSVEENNAINVDDIKVNSEITYERAINDIRELTAQLKEDGYFDENRDLVVNQRMINTTYFMAAESTMSPETGAALVNNSIISSDMNDNVTDVRNMLEIAAIEDNHYAKGESDHYFDLSGFFNTTPEAARMYADYVEVLNTIRNLDKLPANERAAVVNTIYNDLYKYAIDNNSATFGDRKELGAGLKFLLDALLRKNVLATLVETGDLSVQQYEAIAGKHTEVVNGIAVETSNTQVTKNNDIWDIIRRYPCFNIQTTDSYAYAASDDEVKGYTFSK